MANGRRSATPTFFNIRISRSIDKEITIHNPSLGVELAMMANKYASGS